MRAAFLLIIIQLLEHHAVWLEDPFELSNSSDARMH